MECHRKSIYPKINTQYIDISYRFSIGGGCHIKLKRHLFDMFVVFLMPSLMAVDDIYFAHTTASKVPLALILKLDWNITMPI